MTSPQPEHKVPPTFQPDGTKDRVTGTFRVRRAAAVAAACTPILLLTAFVPEREQSAGTARDLPLGNQPALPAAPDPKDLSTSTTPVESDLPLQRGVALGLFAEDISFSYLPLLKEIASLGATHVALVVPLYQEHGSSTEIYRHTRYSPTLEAIADAIRDARRSDLEVTLFPIVRLLAPRKSGEWRGTLAPQDTAKWFHSYEAHLGDLAALATFTGATRLVVGSELSSLDVDLEHWRPLLDRLRGLFSGTLVYSANWDHYQDASILGLVDEIGVTGYFRLREDDGPADVISLTGRWRGLRSKLEQWSGRMGKPFVFTEVGYRSRTGSSATPWDETPGGTPNVNEQAYAFDAFRRAWAGAHSLAGVYIWNWYGYGGNDTISYTPRGKPATEVVKRLLEEL